MLRAFSTFTREHRDVQLAMDKAHAILKETFGFDSFRLSQEQVCPEPRRVLRASESGYLTKARRSSRDL